MTEETLQENGYAKYFSIAAHESGPRLMDYLRSHPQTPELFIGCKHKNLNETLVSENRKSVAKKSILLGRFYNAKRPVSPNALQLF